MGWPGLGPLLLEAILARDVYVVIGATMCSAVLLLIARGDRRFPAARRRSPDRADLSELMLSPSRLVAADGARRAPRRRRSGRLSFPEPFRGAASRAAALPSHEAALGRRAGSLEPAAVRPSLGGAERARRTARTDPNVCPSDSGSREAITGSWALVPARRRLFGLDDGEPLFLLGTDSYGRDCLARLLHGGQVSLTAGLLAALVSCALALLLGGMSGYRGGWTDRVIMHVSDLFLALPWLYLLFAVRAFLPLDLEPGRAFGAIVLLLGVIGWARPGRLVRGVVLSAKEREFVVAARAFGARDGYILRKHVLPQALGVLLTQAALLMPVYVLAEVTLSFVGLGVAEPLPSWGTMLASLLEYTCSPRRGGCSPRAWLWSPSPGSTIPAWRRRRQRARDGGLLASEIIGSGRGTRLGRRIRGWVIPAALGVSLSGTLAAQEESLVVQGEPGRRGGRLVASLRSEPKTLNPLLARDSASRTVVDLLMADLVHINRRTHLTEPSVAKSWEVSEDGRRYTLELGADCDSPTGILSTPTTCCSASGSISTRRSPRRSGSCSIIGGEPIRVRKEGPFRVVFELAQPYGAGERIFDLVAILPRHLLEKPYREGQWARVWGPGTPPGGIAGLGPFRLKESVPGERILLERNPHFWKSDSSGERLPYLDEILFLVVASEPAEVMRFRSGDTHLITGFERPELRGDGAGGGREPLRAPRPGTRPRVHVPLLQHERRERRRKQGADCAGRDGSAAGASGERSRRPSTRSRSSIWSTGHGPLFSLRT